MAMEYLSASARITVSDTSKLSILASLLLEAGRTDAARPYLERWVMVSPTSESINWLAIAYARLNELVTLSFSSADHLRHNPAIT
jgi:hypothetical protein